MNYPNYGGPTHVVPTSGLAVGGFVLALLGIAPAGLWLSLAAMRHTRTGARGGHGFAVAGAIIGGLGTLGWLLFVLFVVGVGAAMESPSGAGY